MLGAQGSAGTWIGASRCAGVRADEYASTGRREKVGQGSVRAGTLGHRFTRLPLFYDSTKCRSFALCLFLRIYASPPALVKGTYDSSGTSTSAPRRRVAPALAPTPANASDSRGRRPRDNSSVRIFSREPRAREFADDAGARITHYARRSPRLPRPRKKKKTNCSDTA